MYTLLGRALVLHYKLIHYAKHAVPTHLNFIYRVNTENGKVSNDLCAREGPIEESQFYYIGGWDRQSGMYHRFYLNGRILKEHVGDNVWTGCSSRDLVKKLVGLFALPQCTANNAGVLAVLIDSVDVTSTFSDIKVSISTPNNLTAAALVLLYKYLNSHIDTSIRTFAVEALTAETQDVNVSITCDMKVTIVDVDLCENERSGNDLLFVCV